ncbi:MAG: type II secretion system F family protein [Chloroflexi bacterium]|nr:type II secretion system F family protein [Chloroflexota bacterium]MDA0242872.1 type II secretion system F family protein [Chloroflexota bacterium]
MDTTTLLIIVGAFGGLLVLGAAIALLSGGGGRNVNVNERLEQFTTQWDDQVVEESTSSNRREAVDRLDKAITSRNINAFDKIKRNLARADIKLRVVEYIGALLLSSFGLGLVAFLFFGQSLIFALIGGIIGLQIPRYYVNASAKKRIRTFDEQLSDTLNLWVNSLRSGFSVLQGMEAIATELPPPVSREFERILQEIRLGIGMEAALANSLRRVPSEDYDMVITAINVQIEVGGNLTEILDTISFTIRERVRIKGEIRTLTSQGRASGWIITLLPIALGIALYMINREYIMEIFVNDYPYLWPDVIPCGWAVIAVAGIMIAAGGYAIQRIVDIEI